MIKSIIRLIQIDKSNVILIQIDKSNVIMIENRSLKMGIGNKKGYGNRESIYQVIVKFKV